MTDRLIVRGEYVLLYTIVDFKSSLELVLHVWFISTLNKSLNWIELYKFHNLFKAFIWNMVMTSMSDQLHNNSNISLNCNV